MKRVLIVEDELIPASYLQRILKKEGYDVVATAISGDAAMTMAQTYRPEIILMDIMLQGGVSGTEAAMKIKQALPDAIIIFLTAYSDERMVDAALDTGAYAYLVKPYRDSEIIATMKMAQKHCVGKPKRHAQVLLVEGYRFDQNSRQLFNAEREVELGPRALALLALLCEQPNISLSHAQIMGALWEQPVSEQTLRSLVHRIREATCKALVVNTSKTGYKVALAKGAASV